MVASNLVPASPLVTGAVSGGGACMTPGPSSEAGMRERLLEKKEQLEKQVCATFCDGGVYSTWCLGVGICVCDCVCVCVCVV